MKVKRVPKIQSSLKQIIQLSIYLSMLPYKHVSIYKLPEHEGEEGP